MHVVELLNMEMTAKKSIILFLCDWMQDLEERLQDLEVRNPGSSSIEVENVGGSGGQQKEPPTEPQPRERRHKEQKQRSRKSRKVRSARRSLSPSENKDIDTSEVEETSPVRQHEGKYKTGRRSRQ